MRHVRELGSFEILSAFASNASPAVLIAFIALGTSKLGLQFAVTEPQSLAISLFRLTL